MTQKNKELLLKDVCGRLPYGVKVQVYDNRYTPTALTKIDIKKKECIFNFNVPVENCLPYLRPMSSMTEPEKKELEDICTMYNEDPCSTYEYFGVEIFNISRYGTNFDLDYTAIDWLNAHHFDYRGLIKKGLALEASEDMYNIK